MFLLEELVEEPLAEVALLLEEVVLDQVYPGLVVAEEVHLLEVLEEVVMKELLEVVLLFWVVLDILQMLDDLPVDLVEEDIMVVAAADLVMTQKIMPVLQEAVEEVVL